MVQDAYIYARVSSKEQEREGFSIPAQLELLREHARKQGLQVVAEFAEAETAKKAGRGEFQKLIAQLSKETKPVSLLVEKTDRLTRNFQDIVHIDTMINKHGLRLHLVKEGEVIDQTSNSHAKFIFGLKVLMAKQYIDNLSEEVRKGQLQKAKGGGWPTVAPFGYKNANKQLEINTDQAVFVMRAFQLYATGLYSIDAVRDKLYQEGLIYRSYLPKITRSHLHTMLKSRIYIGEVEFKGQVYPGNHTALIDRELWQACQEAFGKDGKPVSMNRREFAYRSLITCGECGRTVVGELKKAKYVYYRCPNKDCSQKKYIKEEDLDLQVAASVAALVLPETGKADIARAYIEMDKLHKVTNDEEIARITAEIKRADTNLNRAYMDRLNGLITEAMYREVSQRFTETSEAQQARLAKYSAANVSYYQTGRMVLELPEKLAKSMRVGNPTEKSSLLKLACSNLILDGGNLRLAYIDVFRYASSLVEKERNRK